MSFEDLPGPLAFPCARAAALERPSPALLRDCASALVELLVVRMLAETSHRPESMSFGVESAMRLTLLEPLTAESWLDLYAALEHGGLTDLLDWPSELPATTRAALGGVPVLEWLERSLHAEAPPVDLAETTAAVARCARTLLDLPPWWVLRCAEAPGGFEVQARRLVGTRWPEIERVAVSAPIAPGPCFWDGSSDPVPLPPWLARWDGEQGALRFTAGRDGGRFGWRCRRSPDDVVWEGVAPEGLPPFLHEPTFATPAGVDRHDPHAATTAFPRPDSATQRMIARVASPPAPRPTTEPGSVVPGATLSLRVIAGADLLRSFELGPGVSCALGRQPDGPGLAVHHHQASRHHAVVVVDAEGGVRVRDLGSTNGTQIFGPVPGLPPRTLRLDDAPIHPGDTLGIGPVLVRLEWSSAERRARLAELAALRSDDDQRDPATLLLRPQRLKEVLPEVARRTFRDGGEPRPGDPRVVGALFYVDRLAAVHAQYGEKVADRSFRDVARILQYEISARLDGPLATAAASLARVGYGEVLLPIVDPEDDAAVHAEIERLVAVLGAHPFEAPVERLTLTAAIVEKEALESAADWLKRARRLLQTGRAMHGRSHVFR